MRDFFKTNDSNETQGEAEDNFLDRRELERDIRVDELQGADFDGRTDEDDEDLFGETGEIIPKRLRGAFEDQGYSLRMVRYSVGGAMDMSNIQKRLRQGYVFVRPDEIKDYIGTAFLAQKYKELTTFRDEGDIVTRGDLALMKIQLAKRDRNLAAQTQKTEGLSKAADLASNTYLKFGKQADHGTKVQTGFVNRSASFKDPS